MSKYNEHYLKLKVWNTKHTISWWDHFDRFVTCDYLRWIFNFTTKYVILLTILLGKYMSICRGHGPCSLPSYITTWRGGSACSSFRYKTRINIDRNWRSVFRPCITDFLEGKSLWLGSLLFCSVINPKQN